MKQFLVLFSMFLFCSIAVLGQERTITGTVTSGEDGSHLPGVAVVIKGTTSGVTSSSDGSYSITISGPTAILEFSFFGMQSQEIQVTRDRNTYDVVMQPTVIGLDDVIVTAYGTSTRANFTGSATTIKAEKLEKVEAANFTQGLQGVAPGLLVKSTNSTPGRDPEMRIRGISSVTGSNEPLIILDGAPYEGRLSLINPNSIESVTVLKDANSTALYGSRASSGVIVITTKKAKTGKPVINFKTSFGISKMTVPYYEPLDAGQFMEIAWQANYNDELDKYASEPDYTTNFAYYDGLARQYATDIITPQNFQEWPGHPGEYLTCFNTNTPVGLDGKLKPGVETFFQGDWFGETIHPGFTQDYTIDISGGDERVDYLLSASYLDDKGMVTVQRFERFNLKGAVNAWMSDKIRVGTSVMLSHGLANDPNQGNRIVSGLSPIYPVYCWDYENNEYYLNQYGYKIPDAGTNPITGWTTRRNWSGNWNPLKDGRYKNDKGYDFNAALTDMVVSRTYLEWDIIPGLKFNTTLAADASLYRYHSYISFLHTRVTDINRGSASKSSDFSSTISNTNLLNFTKSINDQHNISVMLGQELYYYNIWRVNSSRVGMPLEGLWEVSSGSTMQSAGSSEDNDRMLSFFSRAEYNFMQRYYISGSLRADASSRFHPDYRWGQFGSIAGSWRISEEQFMSSISNVIDNLKIKVSYGTTGNNRVGLYEYSAAYSTGVNDFDYPGVRLSRLPNERLSWESNVQTDIGLEFSLFRRISGYIDYFIKTSKDLLFEVDLPSSTGYPSITKNTGELRNNGIELDLNATIINTNLLRWDVGVTYTSFRDEITKLPEGQDEIWKQIHRGAYQRWVVGGSIYDLYGPKAYGIDETNGLMTWYMNEFQVDGEGVPVLDENGEKIIIGLIKTTNWNQASSEEHRYNLGNSLPTAFGLVSTSLNIKGFDLSASLFYSFGGKIYDYLYQERRMYRAGQGLGQEMLDAWTPENTQTDVAKVTLKNNKYGSNFSDFLLYDNTYFRLRNVTIGYTVPENISSRARMTRLRIYFDGSNLFTWGEAAKVRDMDPEMALHGVYTMGGDGSQKFSLSSRKIFTFGIQASF